MKQQPLITDFLFFDQGKQTSIQWFPFSVSSVCRIPETLRHGHGDMKTWRHEDMKTKKHGDIRDSNMEKWIYRHGHGDMDKET